LNKLLPLITFFVLLLVPTGAQNAFAGAADFSTPINLSQSTFSSISSQVVVNGDFVYVAWTENQNILFKRSTDGGKTFSSTPLTIDSTSGFQSNLRLAATGIFVYVSWEDQSQGPMGEDFNDVFFSRSIDNGATFSSPENLSQNTFSDTPRLAISGDNVYVGWREGTGFVREVFVAISSNNGQSFPDVRNVSQSASIFGGLTLTTSGNELYVAWSERVPSATFDIFFSKSVNNGPFSTPINISNTPSLTSSFPITIVSEGNFVYVVWRESNASFIAVSSDSGDNFGAGKAILSSVNCQAGIRPATSGNDVYAAFTEPCAAPDDIFFTKSSNNGGTFSPSIDLGSGPGHTGFDSHKIVETGGKIYVAWIDSSTGNRDPYIVLSENAGTSFNSPIILSSSPDASFEISLTGSGGNAYLTWAEGVFPDVDVFFSTNACFPSDPACGVTVGGELLPLDSTALLLAGAQSFSWMIPVVLSVLGIGLFVVSRKFENS